MSTKKFVPVFNHTGHIAMWNYVIEVLSSITEETIRNTSPDIVNYTSYFEDYSGGGIPNSINSIKLRYLGNKWSIASLCYACEYARTYGLRHSKDINQCDYCPFKGIDTNLTCMDDIYNLCCDTYRELIDKLFIDFTSGKSTLKEWYIDEFLSSLPEVISVAELIRDFPVRDDVQSI